MVSRPPTLQSRDGVEPMLEKIKDALVEILGGKAYTHTAPPDAAPPYAVISIDDSEDFMADMRHAESAFVIGIEFYTKDPQIESTFIGIQDALQAAAVTWRFYGVTYESETGILHYSWTARG